MRVSAASFESGRDDIIDRQLAFLRAEHLPPPLVRQRVNGETVFHPTRKQPTRYLLAKLHKTPVAFRSITTCFSTTSEGAGKLVHACLAGMLPTLHALWREAGLPIVIVADECWITLVDPTS